ncbi:winged helix-turn-helix transcriptional regulator [Petrocella sp. FN5]|uniref:winged helix-turn-helix transcriptional regulator n=1 Tax=Petrocella sp. FN5 TaxID=3032002 RepID=UPI0023DC5EEC|nr:winged helix-turn-helix transcriptional regulator [Petrocella sp. FN5]MDF1616154.1 winged helix-turn-helix transcriptional regulator [Petrocella sp. FN5]
MADSKSIFSDNEYTIMSEIVENENVTQRELSKKLGISVSTVNVLVNKMIKEGLIKMTQVSQKQVFYMLTPIGMMEKAKKTVSYLKGHYRAIFETKEKIKTIFQALDQEHDAIFVLLGEDEMAEIMGIAVTEFNSKQNQASVNVLNKKNRNEIKNFKSPVLVHMTVNEEILKEYEIVDNLNIVNLAEKL